MILSLWARKWGIDPRAIEDLMSNIIPLETPQNPSDPYVSESRAQSEVRLEAVEKRGRLWRNNVGATKTEGGGYLRYGLANDSTAVNKVLKSADLFGIVPIKIGLKHVGCTFGLATSREIKRPGWKYKATEREQGQLNWALLVLSLGGDAAFATGRGTL